MSNKRRNTSSPECEESPERQQTQSVPENLPYDDYSASEDEASNEKPQLDTSTGQAGAFPGLGNTDEIFYGPANDGIDYLRMVRSEAKGIPQLLRAQVEELNEYDEEEAEDDGGYWDYDGTFTAAPYVAPEATGSTMPKAQIEYYQSLLAQFAVVRATMKCLPPLSAVEKLTSSQPISFPTESKNARRSWKHCLNTRYPHPVQVACMDENSVLELLRFMTVKMRGLFENQQLEPIQRIGAWIWATLGKCPDRGQLGSEEISELRQFARKAVEVRDWLQKRKEKKSVVEDIIDEEDTDQDLETNSDKAIVSDIEAAKARLAQQDVEVVDSQDTTIPIQDDDRSPFQESKVILDVIITVVGELYGQRDLLDLRQIWDENMAQPV